MFIQLMLHWFGDYITQSDWMALNKTKKGTQGDMACMIHCFLYAFPFVFLLPKGAEHLWSNELIIATILWSHFFIDRFSLAKYLIWLKNHLNPKFTYWSFDLCKITGYRDEALNGGFGGTAEQYCQIRPLFLTMWLYIITDNGLHILMNYIALKYL